jgi:magnesium chelatase family protein
MLAILDTAVVSGLRGELVRVEVDVAPGLPSCQIVGLPDASLSEARERVRSAIRNAGFAYPLSRITVNLAPADRRKHGAAYDVAIAIGILLASEQLRASGGAWALLGELSLDGGIMPVRGVLPMVSTLREAGHRRVCVPLGNREEAGLVSDMEVIGVEGLDDVARLVAGPRGRTAAAARRRTPIRVAADGQASGTGTRNGATGEGGPASGTMGAPGAARPTELADVRGQQHARWALEVAIAGQHNLLLIGSPGAGKTLLARAAPGLLPRLSEEEAREVSVIRSVAGLDQPFADRLARPFLAPHHTASYAAMVGGGPALRPGLVTQAHHGVLFLDELAEFDRDVLDALRQPLEDGSVEIVRAHGAVRYPARLQLIAAMNPCRCGWQGDPARACRCPAREPERYMRRVSGPLLDRIDLRVVMPRLAPEELVGAAHPEASAAVAERIARAWEAALTRNAGRPNALLRGRRLLEACAMDRRTREDLMQVAGSLDLTARSVHRIMRVGRTIADLRGLEPVSSDEILAAASLRDRSMETELAA